VEFLWIDPDVAVAVGRGIGNTGRSGKGLPDIQQVFAGIGGECCYLDQSDDIRLIARFRHHGTP
jgi:hypothetical protein